MIDLLHYKHRTDKRKYISYISVTHKVLKSCRSKMATLEHDVCDVHEASLLYIKTCWQSLYMVFPTGRGMGESPTNQKSAHSSPPHKIFIPSHQKQIICTNVLFSLVVCEDCLQVSFVGLVVERISVWCLVIVAIFMVWGMLKSHQLGVAMHVTKGELFSKERQVLTM